MGAGPDDRRLSRRRTHFHYLSNSAHAQRGGASGRLAKDGRSGRFAAGDGSPRRGPKRRPARQGGLSFHPRGWHSAPGRSLRLGRARPRRPADQGRRDGGGRDRSFRSPAGTRALVGGPGRTGEGTAPAALHVTARAERACFRSGLSRSADQRNPARVEVSGVLRSAHRLSRPRSEDPGLARIAVETLVRSGHERRPRAHRGGLSPGMSAGRRRPLPEGGAAAAQLAHRNARHARRAQCLRGAAAASRGSAPPEPEDAFPPMRRKRCKSFACPPSARQR